MDPTDGVKNWSHMREKSASLDDAPNDSTFYGVIFDMEEIKNQKKAIHWRNKQPFLARGRGEMGNERIHNQMWEGYKGKN